MNSSATLGAALALLALLATDVGERGAPPAAHSARPESDFFDCDVPPGRFAEWNRTVDGRELRVTGEIELVEPRADPTWEPVANVLVRGQQGSAPIGFRVFVDGKSPEIAQVLLLGPRGPIFGDALIARSWRDAAIPFTMSLNRSGELKVTAGGESRALHPSGFTAQRVALVCSTGQFRYTNISVEVTD